MNLYPFPDAFMRTGLRPRKFEFWLGQAASAKAAAPTLYRQNCLLGLCELNRIQNTEQR
jgi:hypothetical protein